MKRELVIDLRMYRMSGIGRYLQAIMPLMVPLLSAGPIVVLGDSVDLGQEEWTANSKVEVRDYRARIFSVAEQVQSARQSGKAGLLWVPQYNIPLLYRGRLIVTIHDLCHLVHPETLSSNLQRWYARTLLSAVARRADAILCVSDFTSNEVQKHLGVEASRITVTYPGVGLASGLSAVVSARSEATPTVHREQPYILAVGNVKVHKNLRRLVDAFVLVHDRIPHRLLIVGKREGFINADASFGEATGLMGDRIRFIGQISDAQLLDYYRNASALVYPSLYEGFGFPLLEAMALGCPVTCSNTASLPEVAGNAALLFDPYDRRQMGERIVEIVSDATLRDKLIASGFERAERYSSRLCAEKTAEVINGHWGDSPGS